MLRILGSRGRHPRWTPRLIEGLDHRGVADALRASPIFLNFPVREGLPLPALEAMASGCIVVGYSGRGGSEYLLPDCAFPVPEGDSIRYAQVVEEVIEEYEMRSSRIEEMAAAAIERVRSEYSLTRQDREAVEVFSSLAPSRVPVARSSGRRMPMKEILAGVSTPSRARVAAYHARAAIHALTSKRV